jgi:cytochrome c551/c552
MQKLLVLIFCAALMYACGGNTGDSPSENGSTKSTPEKKVDDGKGVGEIKEVTLNNPLHADMVDKGKAIYDMKCSACHKLTDQRVVGPGWKGVTSRRKPEWIMNMTTNVEVMLAEDPAAQALLKECLVRMPNQNLSVGDARDVLEFMYMNDGMAVGN